MRSSCICRMPPRPSTTPSRAAATLPAATTTRSPCPGQAVVLRLARTSKLDVSTNGSGQTGHGTHAGSAWSDSPDVSLAKSRKCRGRLDLRRNPRRFDSPVTALVRTVGLRAVLFCKMDLRVRHPKQDGLGGPSYGSCFAPSSKVKVVACRGPRRIEKRQRPCKHGVRAALQDRRKDTAVLGLDPVSLPTAVIASSR